MEGNQLTVVERAAIALGTPEHEKKLRELVSQSASIVEIKNADARTQCHAAYMVLKNARVEIEKAGKTAREDATAFSKAVIEEQKRLVEITAAEEARLQGLRDVWDEAREVEKREKAEEEAHAKALRELAEAQERAEREQHERERAENRAAMLAPEITGGNWRVGKHSGCVVTDAPIPGAVGSGHSEVEYYGGNLICESVYRPADARLIAAAPDLLSELQNIANAKPETWDEETRDQFQQWAQNRARAAIAKATLAAVPA